MFKDYKLNPILQRNIANSGYVTPTPVQSSAIPVALEGHDLVATAETGSGKTAAFLVPIMQRLQRTGRGSTRALILCPTREMTLQTDQEARKLGLGTGLKSTTVYGGVSIDPQIRAIRAGADIIVATPGRLLDHMDRGTVSFHGLQVLVLDEADRMLDMGFLPDLKRIMDRLPATRQTLLFSATMPQDILSLAERFMNSPVRVAVGRPSAPPRTIAQAVYTCASDSKTPLLLDLIQDDGMGSVLVFTRTKHRADKLARHLFREGVNAACIHGDRTQRQREAALDGFRRGSYRVLVATDIAARGLDVTGVTHVINYDLPESPDDYIHRIGRTARAGRSGQAVSLVTPDDFRALKGIEKALGHTIRRMKPNSAATVS